RARRGARGAARGGRGRSHRTVRCRGRPPAYWLCASEPQLLAASRSSLEFHHRAPAPPRPRLPEPARRAQGARLRRLRRPGPSGERRLPGREHGTADAGRFRALPRRAGGGAGHVTAILLAAGVGKRLHGRSGGRPKCLIEIGGKSLLRRLLEALAAAGIADVTVVVGFGEEALRAALDPPPVGLRLRVVTNPRYREGAILSLWAARDALDGPVLVMDADVLCAPVLVGRLVS